MVLILSPNGTYTKKSSLASAVAAPFAIGKTIVVTEPITCESVTIPSTIALEVKNGGLITVNSGHELIINGPYSGPLAQCFAGAGSVVFGLNALTEVYPEWWGAVATEYQSNPWNGSMVTPNDCTPAIVSAITSIRFNYQRCGRTVKFQAGAYGVTHIDFDVSSLYANGLTLRGTGSNMSDGFSASKTNAGGGTTLRSISASQYMFKYMPGSFEIHLEDLTLDGYCQKDAVILMAPTSGGPSEAVNFHRFKNVFFINVKDGNSFITSTQVGVAYAENALIEFEKCSFQLRSPLNGAVRGGSINLQNPGAWEWRFNNCYFSGPARNTLAHLYVLAGGIVLNQCYFEDNDEWYNIMCSDAGYVHCYECMSLANRFASFYKSNIPLGYTTNRGIIVNGLQIVNPSVSWVSSTWMIIVDSDNNVDIRNMSAGGVYLRSGSGDAYLENITGGPIEFGNRADTADTYTGTATLVNCESMNTEGVVPALLPSGTTIVEGTSGTVLQKFVAADLLSNLSVFHVLGTEAFYLSSYKEGVGYKDLRIRALRLILEDNDFQLLGAGKGVMLRTPDDTKTYKITVNNAGAVVSTLI